MDKKSPGTPILNRAFLALLCMAGCLLLILAARAPIFAGYRLAQLGRPEQPVPPRPVAETEPESLQAGFAMNNFPLRKWVFAAICCGWGIIRWSIFC